LEGSRLAVLIPIPNGPAAKGGWEEEDVESQMGSRGGFSTVGVAVGMGIGYSYFVSHSRPVTVTVTWKVYRGCLNMRKS
jgi:hypothetical protein